MKGALVGLAAVVAVAGSLVLLVFAWIDSDQRAEFDQEVERVQWSAFSGSRWLATWRYGTDSLTLEPGGRCRYDFGFQDDDLFLSEEYRGSWEASSNGLILRCEKAPAILRSGRLDGQDVLVSDGRIWRRQSE